MKVTDLFWSPCAAGTQSREQVVRGEVPTLAKELAITSAGTGEAGQGEGKGRDWERSLVGGGMQDRHAERPMG